VIVQGTPRDKSAEVAAAVRGLVETTPGRARGLTRRFRTISAVAAELTGRQLLRLARRTDILAITPDARVALAAGSPLNVAPPEIAGTPELGQTLTVSAGTWEAVPPVEYAYQWQRCAPAGECADIADASGGSYALTAADAGVGIRAQVTATDVTGSAAATSAILEVARPEQPPVPVAPSPSAPPTIAGTPKDEGTLTVAQGSWSGSDPLAHAYQWQRCGRYRATVLRGSPSAYWRLGETDGTLARDESGNGFAGTYFAGTTLGAGGALQGDLDRAALLDGVSGQVQVAGVSASVFNSGFTLEAWVKADTAQADRGLVGKWRYVDGGGALLWLDTSGNYTLAVTSDQTRYLRTTVAPAIGEWEHLVGTWDGATLRLYRNGALLGARAFAGFPGETAANFRIGNRSGGDGHAFDGALDEVALYRRALSAEEIQAHFEAAASDCRDVNGATEPAYAPSAEDVYATLRVVETASNAAGSASAASSLTTPVSPLEPGNVAPPIVTGAPAEGETLSALPGTWTGTQPLEYTYRWERCEATGVLCVGVPGETRKTYTLTAGDLGTVVRVVVTATNGGGSSSAASLPTPTILKYFSSRQYWPYSSGAAKFWALASDPATAVKAPTIAIVDSGIEAGRADFGGRVAHEVVLTSLAPNSAGDGRGHGTFVASIAAGEAKGYTGAAPNADLVSIDVMDDAGMARTSDVITAADWIYANKEAYGIRVANFSMRGSVESSFRFDPVTKAVERLWLGGVVVVTSSGNYAVDGQPSGVLFSPGNDPFVITAGALDIMGSLAADDDVAAPWSAYGYTPDGFAKPELGAPGRYMVGAVPLDSTLALERPDALVEGGYMQLSGTSFAAPVVSGAAADLLAVHPSWTPDQVKGALMLSAEPLPLTPPLSAGVGAVNVARGLAVEDPPNPNLALAQFLVPDPNGSSVPVFDAERWATVVAADPNWAAAYWGSAHWGSALWGSAHWGSAYWGSAHWGSAHWGSESSESAHWGSSTSFADDAAGEALPAAGYWITPSERARAEDELGLPHLP
jgi:serine protease AprX